MPLFKNRQPSSVEVNNSFFTKESGSYLSYKEGRLFSNSGEPFLFTGRAVDKASYYIGVDIDYKTLYGTGLKIVEKNQDSESTFFLKSNTTNPISSYLNGDIFLFKNSGENPTFNSYLSKTSGGYNVLIGSGNVNGISILEPNSFFFKEKHPLTKNGQLIYCAVYSSQNQSLEISSFNQISNEDQTQFLKNESNDWAVTDFTIKIPICVVDFNRESIVSLLRSNINTSTNSEYAGINGYGYPSI
jgi:hypothetical protein